MSPKPGRPDANRGLLVWSSSTHWSEQARPCRYCQKLTNLRDDSRRPAHKVCAERVLATQRSDAASTYLAQGELSC